MFREMEKLIELLNDYLEKYKPRLNLVKEITDGGYFVNNRNDNDGFLCETIMSKKFGFIKWLVENEKIDYEKIEKQTKCKNIVGGKEFLDFDIERDFTPYEEVLMWLAIQDEPINFLISILK